MLGADGRHSGTPGAPLCSMRTLKGSFAPTWINKRLRIATCGFTLVETAVAMAVSVVAMAAFFVSAGQAIRIVRAGNETMWASQLLQRRNESFHTTRLWSNITTVSAFATLVSNAPAAPPNFAGGTETYTVSAYPPTGASFTVVRSPNGTTSSSGSSLSTSQKCVKITARIVWTGVARVSRSRDQATLMAKGAL